LSEYITLFSRKTARFLENRSGDKLVIVLRTTYTVSALKSDKRCRGGPMCPPWARGAHTGAPLQDRSLSYFYERILVRLHLRIRTSKRKAFMANAIFGGTGQKLRKISSAWRQANRSKTSFTWPNPESGPSRSLSTGPVPLFPPSEASTGRRGRRPAAAVLRRPPNLAV